jgi:hypothetical protein
MCSMTVRLLNVSPIFISVFAMSLPQTLKNRRMIAVSSLFSKPKIPAPPPVKRMPAPESPESRAAKLRRQQELAGMRGRESTELEDGGLGT